MKEIIKRFCEENTSNGLLLLQMPTGFGKTYQMIGYLFEVLKRTDTSKKYFYLTSLKKNLPYGQLEKLCKDNNLLFK